MFWRLICCCEIFKVRSLGQRFGGRYHHGLHSSTRHVLTALQPCGNGNWACQWEMAKFGPPTEFTPLNQSPKNLSQVIVIMLVTPMAKPNLVQICPRGLCRQMGEIKRKICIYALFSETHTSDRSTDFHAWQLKWGRLVQGCAFWGFRWYCFPLRGKNSHKTLILRCE